MRDAGCVSAWPPEISRSLRSAKGPAERRKTASARHLPDTTRFQPGGAGFGDQEVDLHLVTRLQRFEIEQVWIDVDFAAAATVVTQLKRVALRVDGDHGEYARQRACGDATRVRIESTGHEWPV